MECCSKNICSLQGALRRAFFCSGWRTLLVSMLVSVLLHVALMLIPLPSHRPLQIHHWQELAVRLEHHRAETVASVPTSSASHALREFAPAKVRQIEPLAVMPPHQAVAETPPESPAKAVAKYPPSTASDSPAPVAGIAFPQPSAMRGRRPLWSFQQGPAVQDGQVLYQAQMQRQAQLAMQTASQAARGKFEAQLMIALRELQLSAACQLVIPATGAVRLHCDEEQDANNLRAVLKQYANPPIVLGDATWFVINMTPLPTGGTEVNSRRVAQEP
jgi:hypothetical protein